jgi:hypothetical protein
MQYNDKSESTETAKRIQDKLVHTQDNFNERGRAAQDIKREAAKAEMGDEFTEKKFRE